MQVGILTGIYTDQAANFRQSYPRNLVPVPQSQGISAGYLRPADGLVSLAAVAGIDRGGINWNGVCYRVVGTRLISVTADGTVTDYGDVGAGGTVSLDYSFDRLGIASGGRLYYLQANVLSQVTDPDLGIVLDMVWIGGYFLTTDGTSLVVTELADPTSVNPLKYGSSESDPDPIVAVRKLRNEAYAFNRYTTEVLQNIGGTLFPFQRIEGAQVQRGAIGPHAVCIYAEVFAMVGSARNEPPAVYLVSNGQTQKISTREIDLILQGYSEAVLSQIVVESVKSGDLEHLRIHLPDQTICYDIQSSKLFQQQVWFVLTSSVVGLGQYRARNFVWCYDQWIGGDPATPQLVTVTKTSSAHFGQVIGWEFGTAMLYNGGKGAIAHCLELVSLPGNVPLGADPTIWTNYSIDGRVWTAEMPIKAGKAGDYSKRIQWRRQGHMRNVRMQKFCGTSDTFLSMARLEVELEPLYA